MINRTFPPQSRTMREQRYAWAVVGARDEGGGGQIKFPNPGNRQQSICTRTSHPRPQSQRLSHARCSLLIMPNERSDALRRLDIS